MFNVALHEPEIPPNTGNVMRLCANTGCILHLIEPFPFLLEDARLRRAGLDYRERMVVEVHPSFEELIAKLAPDRVFAFTGHATRLYSDVAYRRRDMLLFGKESVGLAPEILSHPVVTDRLAIPMTREGRSLNLANAVSIVVYEGWRQLGFPGATAPRSEPPAAG